MTTRLDGRIAKLELHTAHLDDAILLEWGQTVTDDELRILAAMPTPLHGRRTQRSRGQPVAALSDVELYRAIKPAVDALRRSGSSHEQA